MSANSRDVTIIDVNRVIIDVNSIVSGRNYAILILCIAQLLMSQPFADLCRFTHSPAGACLSGYV